MLDASQLAYQVVLRVEHPKAVKCVGVRVDVEHDDGAQQLTLVTMGAWEMEHIKNCFDHPLDGQLHVVSNTFLYATKANTNQGERIPDLNCIPDFPYGRRRRN